MSIQYPGKKSLNRGWYRQHELILFESSKLPCLREVHNFHPNPSQRMISSFQHNHRSNDVARLQSRLLSRVYVWRQIEGYASTHRPTSEGSRNWLEGRSSLLLRYVDSRCKAPQLIVMRAGWVAELQRPGLSGFALLRRHLD